MADINTKGWKTSEFWVTVITSIFAAVNASGVLPFKFSDEIVMTIAGTAAAYIASRVGLKIANKDNV